MLEIILAVVLSLITLLAGYIWIKEARELHRYWGHR